MMYIIVPDFLSSPRQQAICLGEELVTNSLSNYYGVANIDVEHNLSMTGARRELDHALENAQDTVYSDIEKLKDEIAPSPPRDIVRRNIDVGALCRLGAMNGTWVGVFDVNGNPIVSRDDIYHHLNVPLEDLQMYEMDVQTESPGWDT